MNLKLRTAVVFLVLLCASLSNAQMKKLSEAQAVELAEKFIAQNGYTDLPPEKDKIVYESFEWVVKVDEMLKRRHNTLKREAYGLSRGRKNGAPGWTVVFRASGDDGRGKQGRAVTMNPDGRKMRVEHLSFILSRVEKRL
jgi:hypothetical protein